MGYSQKDEIAPGSSVRWPTAGSFFAVSEMYSRSIPCRSSRLYSESAPGLFKYACHHSSVSANIASEVLRG
jgi:hypothetical protein